MPHGVAVAVCVPASVSASASFSAFPPACVSLSLSLSLSDRVCPTRRRWPQLELEFVQCLANPSYLHCEFPQRHACGLCRPWARVFSDFFALSVCLNVCLSASPPLPSSPLCSSVSVLALHGFYEKPGFVHFLECLLRTRVAHNSAWLPACLLVCLPACLSPVVTHTFPGAGAEGRRLQAVGSDEGHCVPL